MKRYRTVTLDTDKNLNGPLLQGNENDHTNSEAFEEMGELVVSGDAVSE